MVTVHRRLGYEGYEGYEPFPMGAHRTGWLVFGTALGLTLCLFGCSLYRRRSGRRRYGTASEDSDDVPPQYVGAFVIVVGLGGVGSHAAALLADRGFDGNGVFVGRGTRGLLSHTVVRLNRTAPRAGVGKLRVIDFDQVELSLACCGPCLLPKRLRRLHFRRLTGMRSRRWPTWAWRRCPFSRSALVPTC